MSFDKCFDLTAGWSVFQFNNNIDLYLAANLINWAIDIDQYPLKPIPLSNRYRSISSHTYRYVTTSYWFVAKRRYCYTAWWKRHSQHARVLFSDKWGTTNCSQSEVHDTFCRFCRVYPPTFQSKGKDQVSVPYFVADLLAPTPRREKKMKKVCVLGMGCVRASRQRVRIELLTVWVESAGAFRDGFLSVPPNDSTPRRYTTLWPFTKKKYPQ